VLIRRETILRVVACALALGAPSTARGQDVTESPGQSAMLHFGALALTPRIGLRDVGVDSNVLNASGQPQQDFTTTFLTGADAWLGSGRTRLTSKTEAGWVYYQELATQRSLDFSEQARVEMLLARLAPYAAGGYERTRQRPNLEIDARALRYTTTGSVGTVLRTGGRTSVDARAALRKYTFAQDQAIDAVVLANALNRTEQEVGAALRVALTPLTTFVVAASDEEDRFEFSSIRNSHSVKVLPGFEFKPFALIAGKASVGYRHFNALNVNVPDFSGVVALVDASYTMRDTTRLSVDFSRDVEYSFEVTAPYYIATGGTLSVTQALGTSWDLVGRVGRTTLAYQALSVVSLLPADVSARDDLVVMYGLGIGRRVVSNIRFGMDANWTQRSSVVAVRNYTGVRAGGSVTYGF
jgi:hypothetical protein